MGLSEQVDRDLIDALKARDELTVATLRLLKAAAKNAEVAKRAPLSDEEYLDAVTRQAKLRREAASEFERGGRPDRARRELDEMAVLQRYLPEQLGDDAILVVLRDAVSATGAQGPGDLGKVMSRAMPSLRGRADGSRVNQLARSLLTGSS